MPDYAVDIDVSNPNTSHRQVLDLVGRDRRVLDVGCWTGDLGRVLVERGCEVSGVEIDPEAAAVAEQHLTRVVVADLDRTPLSAQFEAGSFDVVVFADVLEHLHDPHQALVAARTLLAPGGRIVISVPNVSHGSLRLALLQGRWTLTDTGLLDRTHIRFFTRERLAEVLAGAGLVVEELRGTLADPLKVEVEFDHHDLPPGVAEWVRGRPDALVYQFQCAARPAEPGETPGEVVPDLVPAVPPAEVRMRDGLTEEVERAAREELVQRDRMIGLEVRLEETGERARRLRRRVGRQKDEIARLRGQVRDLEQELASTRAGVGGIVRSAYRRLRG